MGTVQLLGSAMGLGLLAGFRLYATALGLGLALKFRLLELSPEMARLEILADNRVLAVAALGFLLEFFADKIPWVDSLWDSVHTLIRPVGAAFLAATAVGTMDPATQVITGLLGGSLALSGHSAKAATRLLVNHSPEPFSNLALSAAGDLAAPFGLWVALEHPYLMLAVLAVFLSLFLWLSPKVFRIVKLELLALGALVGRWFGNGTGGEMDLPTGYPSGPLAPAAGALRARMEPLPEEYLRRLPAGPAGSAAGVRCAAGRGIRGLGTSTGYLCLASSRVVFVARRGFRLRTFEIPLDGVTGCRIRRGTLLDRLILTSSRGEHSFDLFKAAEARERVSEGVLQRS